MNNERCNYCNSEQLTTDDARGEKSCADCGYVLEENQLDDASWNPGEFDPDHESRRPVPMTREQRKAARRIERTRAMNTPKASSILTEIKRLLDVEFGELPESVRKLILGIIARLFARNASIPKFRKVTGRNLQLSLILCVMRSLNQYGDIQLGVVKRERESGVPQNDILWVRRKVASDLRSIFAAVHRHGDSNEARRDLIRRVMSEFFGYMNSDDELSPELVSRLRQLTKAKLTEKGEPLETASTGSRAVSVVVRETIVEASREMNISSSQRKAVAKNLSGAKRRSTSRRGSSSSTA
tara:strand:- start:314 stop:1207 length:894 start_codon:yes stop_codon:yes gene_type:complete